jgi:hypothetical protein
MQKEDAMAQEPLATKGNYLHIYDFRVRKGQEDEFIKSFEIFDYSDGNPMHKSKAQVKDGVLCRDTEDPQRFFLIAHPQDPRQRDQAGIHQIYRGRQIHPEIRRGGIVHAGRDPQQGGGLSVTRARSSPARRADYTGRQSALSTRRLS